MGAALCGGVLALLVAAALPAAASAPESHFSVDDGAVWSRYTRVAIGDAGYSPFFTPASVVFQGGSIIAGHGADPGYEFPTQALRLVPHTVDSYVSSTANAKIADMIASAPTEVDARYRADADLNVVLVLAAGGDFRDGVDPLAEYASLKTYCAARRAAGFQVLVLTVLPCSDPETFEAARLVYNDLIRTNWSSFADGVVDIAADHRIGDQYDNLDQQYFLADALHLNDSGNAVMAQVAAPVLNGMAWRSASTSMRFRDAGGVWSAWRPYASRVTWRFPDGDGTRTVEAEYRDATGVTVGVSDSIRVDTQRPTPIALRPVTVKLKAGKRVTASLPFQVDDPSPCGPTAMAVIVVKDASGRSVKQFVVRRVPIGVAQAVKFACTLSRGRYTYTVTARDTAGNPELAPGKSRLTVR